VADAPVNTEPKPEAEATQTPSEAPSTESAAQTSPVVDVPFAGVSQADIDALMNAAGVADPTPSGSGANEEAAQMVEPTPPPSPAARPTQVQDFEFPQFNSEASPVDAKRISMLSDVNLNVKIELGRTRMLVEDVLKLGEGSVVELDKLAGDPVDVYANDRLVARGEVLVLNDAFCVRISEVVSGDPHRVSV